MQVPGVGAGATVAPGARGTGVSGAFVGEGVGGIFVGGAGVAAGVVGADGLQNVKEDTPPDLLRSSFTCLIGPVTSSN